MSASTFAIKRFGRVLFFAGVLLAFGLTILMVWADVEAFSYGYPRVGNQPVRGLACPAFMNRADSSTLTLRLSNTIERALTPRVQVYVSQPGMARWREMFEPVRVEAGQSIPYTWQVSGEDVVLGNFILVKVYTFASYPQPGQEGSCGIFVFDIPGLSGGSLYLAWLVLSLVLAAAGLYLSDFWRGDGEQPNTSLILHKVLAGLAVLGLAVGSYGLWAVGVLVLLVMVLALVAGFFFREQN